MAQARHEMQSSLDATLELLERVRPSRSGSRAESGDDIFAAPLYRIAKRGALQYYRVLSMMHLLAIQRQHSPKS